MSKLLVVFGSTGATGSHVVRQALASGLRVRAFARDPSKIPDEVRAHSSLEVFEGDFTDMGAIDAAIQGADYVISTAGDARASKKSPLMTAMVEQIVKSMRTHGVKRLVYQAGASSPAPGQPLPAFVRAFMRPVLGGMMGISGMLRDNDGVIQHLADEASDLDWTVTRPGQIKEQPSKGPLRASSTLGGAVHFTDLASFTLTTAQSGSHVRECPWLTY